MSTRSELPPSQRWAQLRFAIIGGLLAQPPPAGMLRARLVALAEQVWQHPITGTPVRFSFSAIRRWYYAARSHAQPTQALARTVRTDRGGSRRITHAMAQQLAGFYRQFRRWSYELHYANLKTALQAQGVQPPSYATVRRYMQRKGMIPQRRVVDRHDTPAAQQTRDRFERREVRLYEHQHTHALWHTDAHHGSIALSHDGVLKRPVLIAVIDDHARYIVHAQWFWDEQARAVAHTFQGAFAKRGLPRMLMSDNGAPFVATEISQGLHRLGILHETTLCYAPNQNGKIEHFWSQVEGRLLAMLPHRRDLDLYGLNELTLAWIEHDYHRRPHGGIDATPLERYQRSPHVGRAAPASAELAQAFTRRATRRQRRSDGTITVAGRRFELPNRYRHLTHATVRCAQWDLDHVWLANPHTDTILERLNPVDPAGNASGERRLLDGVMTLEDAAPLGQSPPPLPPLLQATLDAARATGLSPAFTPLPDPARGIGAAPSTPARTTPS